MKYLSLFFFITILLSCKSQQAFTTTKPDNGKIIPGAERTEVYFPLLKGKRVAVFANNTSIVGNKHLVDTMIAAGIKVVKAFGPEHGFRGTADAGEKVDNYTDAEQALENALNSAGSAKREN